MKSKGSGIIGYAGGLIIDHILALLGSLLVSNIINFFSKSGASALNLIICASIYFTICYVDAWSRGCNDSNRMRLGVIPKNKLRGFGAGFIAAIPGFCLSLLAFIAEIDLVKFYDVFSVDVFTTLNRLWHLPLGNMYVFANDFPVLNFAFPLFLPIVSGLGYIMGVHEITLKYIFVYRNKNDEDDE